jgi:hypothetical protein
VPAVASQRNVRHKIAADPAVVTLTEARPTLRVVRGEPTAEELAVLTALVAAAASAPAAPRERVRRGAWNDPSWLHRRELLPGPNAWRASSLPR